MAILSNKELDIISRLLINKSQSKENFYHIQKVCTQLLFAGCQSKLIRHFCATNLNNPKGDRFYGIIRSVMLDPKITQGNIRNLLKITVYE